MRRAISGRSEVDAPRAASQSSARLARPSAVAPRPPLPAVQTSIVFIGSFLRFEVALGNPGVHLGGW